MKWTKAERDFVETARVARLATLGPNGQPHCVPICPLLLDGRLYVGTDADTAKVRHVQARPRVALVFDDYTDDWAHLRGVMVEGEARVVRGRLFRSVRAKLYRKFLQYEAQAPLSDRDAVALEIIPRRKVSWGF
jgi:nitroimidazol reductase NimA-like FMN-containing flavoprotein (pyridoxamine 5'-phosphate oxidase superfamily)